MFPAIWRSNLTAMLCDVCKCNDATVFLTQILEGKMQKVNLCDACSKEKGVQDPTGFALADLLLGIGAAEEIEKGAPTQKCPVCGFTQADFKKTGRLGCSACYVTFAEGLEQSAESDAQGHRACRQTSAARASRDGTERSDADADRQICRKRWRKRTTRPRPPCAIRSNNSNPSSRSEMKFSNDHGHRRRMAARRGSASSDRHQQPRAAGAQSPAACLSRLGEESGAHRRFWS